MGLSDILPNGFKSFCWIPYTKVSLDYPCFTWCVFAPTITIASNHNLVKVLSGSSAEAMCIKQISSLATREIGFFVHCPIPIVIFPCPACCFKWHASCRRKANGVLGYNKYDYRKSIVIDYVSVCYTDFLKRTTYHQKKIMSHQCHNHKFCVPKK